MLPYYQIQPQLPKIPDGLAITDPAILRKGKNMFSDDPSGDHWYFTHAISDDLYNFLQPHFNFKIKANYQLIGVQLTPHIDVGRHVCYNYLFLTGGDNVRTRWYNDTKTEIVYEATAPLHTWHRIQVDIVHDISEISSQRLSLSVWPDEQ